MKSPLRTFLLGLGLLSILDPQLSTTFAQGTAFTYQGVLTDAGAPASGIYDLRFAIYDAVTNGSAVGSARTNAATSVTNGLFTVALDFGAVFDGNARWLEIGVRPHGSAADFNTLSPRQPLTPTPYAIRAANFGGPVSDSQLPANVARLDASNQAFTGQVQFNNTTNSFAGSFSGNGAGVTNVSLASLNSGGAIDSRNVGATFTLASSPAVGAPPWSVTAAEVNGDAYVDLVSANRLTDTVSVLTNNGNGGFVLAATAGVGWSPWSITAADVNGDGRIDLITANFFAHTLSVLTNYGGGGFLLAGSPHVGSFPTSVAAADINGDSRIDLISENSTDNTLSVLTNDGSGGFVHASSPGVGNSPEAVTTADVNGDGRIDLISANSGDNTLSVITNDGRGRFAQASSTAVGPSPRAVTTADVNGDGRIDVISASFSSDTLSVLTNNGRGGFLLAASPDVGDAPLSVVAVDVNADGRIDLVSANVYATTLSVLTNKGLGSFVLASSPDVGSHPFSVTAADVNGDGRMDLISANQDASVLAVVLGSPRFTGSFRGDFGGNFNGDFSGSFSGDGNLLTGLNASSLATGTVPNEALDNAWKIGGNAGTITGTHFLGTTDNQVLEFKVNGRRALRLEPTPPSTWLDGPNVVGGSQLNSVDPGVAGATIAGGGGLQLSNYFGSPVPSPNRVSAGFGTVSGGSLNTSSGVGATVGGGGANTSSGQYATVPGGRENVAGGQFSFAAGRRAQALHDGALVWADSTDAAVSSTTSNQFTVRATGGVLFLSATNAPAGVELAPGSGTWASLSDRNTKENFTAASSREVLDKVAALPLASWNYKAQNQSVRHLGPTAQDFYAAFGLGESDRTITTVDADGVALAAIQGLNQKLTDKEGELAVQREQISSLQERLKSLEQLVSKLAETK